MNIKEKFINNFFNGCGLAVGFVFTLIFAFGICSIFTKHYPGVNTFLKDQYTVTASNEHLTHKDKISLSQLLEKNKIVSTKDLYENILEYYNVLISFLVAIIGFLVLSHMNHFKIKLSMKQNNK